MEGRSTFLGRALGRLSLTSAAHPKRTIGLIVVLTLLVGGGMTQLETDADLLKILPKDNPHTLAAQNATTEFRGFYDYVTFFYGIDPGKCQAASDAYLPYRASPANCGNITDEAYVRGMDEIWSFIQERIPSAQYAIDMANIIKTVNWTNSGTFGSQPDQAILAPLLAGEPDRVAQPFDEAFALPGTDPVGSLQYEAAWRGANAADDSINDAVAPTFKAGRTLIFFDSTQSPSRVDLGRDVYAAVDAYQAAVAACDDPDPDAEAPCELRWNVFDAEDGLAVRGVSTLDAHASDVTQRDISVLAPIIIWAIIVILYLAFREPRVILVSAANLFTAFLWTAGIMGWLEIPFSALNMTIVPLILGVGIDYGIHMISEFLEHKGDGYSNTEAFQFAGDRAGIAMFIATVTTSAGLLVMAFSPSVLMAQLGIVSSIALVVTFLFTLTLIPAVLTLTAKDATGPRRTHKGSATIPRLAAFVARNRIAALVLLIVTTGAAAASAQNLHAEAFGNPELNYPHGDRVRDDSETINDLFFGGESDTVSNFLIVEGDLTQPEAHVFLDELEVQLEEHPELQSFSVTSLTRIVRAWLAIDGGTPDALVSQFILANSGNEELQDIEYPQTQEEIRATFDAVFASPFANFMTILLAEESYDIGVVTYDTNQRELTFEEAERIWDATNEAVAAARAATGVGPEQVAVHQFGNNAFSYLFIEEEQPWVNTIGYVSFGLVVIMIALLTRNVRATGAIAALMLVTSLWWLGTLPLMGIGLSVGLMLPIVFIMAIGSDDAIHLIWNMEQSSDRAKVYRFVGQAVFLTSITTFIAFGIFSRQTDILVTRTLMATAVAVLLMWLATMLVIPLFYPPQDVTDDAVAPAAPTPSPKA
ncbi:MAG: efflux RND transporter permease subunit [Thermoplasmatota archaeon]